VKEIYAWPSKDGEQDFSAVYKLLVKGSGKGKKL
jgi:hypothetical protein